MNLNTTGYLPMNPFLANSMVNRLVIFSSSLSCSKKAGHIRGRVNDEHSMCLHLQHWDHMTAQQLKPSALPPQPPFPDHYSNCSCFICTTTVETDAQFTLWPWHIWLKLLTKEPASSVSTAWKARKLIRAFDNAPITELLFGLFPCLCPYHTTAAPDLILSNAD